MPSPTHLPTDTGAIGAERSVLEGLLERVEAATGPNIALETLIAIALRDGAEGYPRFPLGSHCDGYVQANMGREGWSLAWRVPAYTASLDAALALCERVLPGWMHDISWWPPSDVETGWTRCTLGGPGYISDDTTTDTFEVTLTGDKPKHALALISAMLRALLAQAPSPATTPTGVLETSLIVEGDSSVAEREGK